MLASGANGQNQSEAYNASLWGIDFYSYEEAKMCPEIEQLTEESTEAEIREFKDEIKSIVNSAGKRRLSIREFAIEIWDNVLLQDVHYLAFSSLLLESATGLPIEVCCAKIDEMMIASLLGNSETTQAAITLMADGLVEYQKRIPKPAS
ncbi:hypothetical protein QUA54_18530 [Microcoleus sp. MOSTC5]|uniref:hypothetical protein n=1 Tax=Microcoleus sp. MOSTC5 TaxID=3055378 RepID=UPI002FD13F2B